LNAEEDEKDDLEAKKKKLKKKNHVFTFSERKKIHQLHFSMECVFVLDFAFEKLHSSILSKNQSII
jgi:hypothetical protein